MLIAEPYEGLLDQLVDTASKIAEPFLEIQRQRKLRELEEERRRRIEAEIRRIQAERAMIPAVPAINPWLIAGGLAAVGLTIVLLRRRHRT